MVEGQTVRDNARGALEEVRRRRRVAAEDVLMRTVAMIPKQTVLLIADCGRALLPFQV